MRLRARKRNTSSIVIGRKKAEERIDIGTKKLFRVRKLGEFSF